MPRFGDRQRHQLCRADACTANNIDEQTYRTQHTPECTDCEDVVLDYETICSTIRAGKTPLVVSIETDGHIKFAVTSDDAVPNGRNPRTGKLPYICISHVWSHGLGNVHRNALPRCQLEILHKRTAPLLTDAALPFSVFWIDTVCVPVNPCDRALRRRAIASMASVYRNSVCVLVLDESLMQTAIHAKPSAVPTFRLTDLIDQRELTFRIIFSDWWRRLWTLQEGVLSATFFVAFAEGPVHFQRTVMARADDHSRNLAHSSSPVIKDMLLNLVTSGHVSDQDEETMGASAKGPCAACVSAWA
ncbi:putative het domain [Diplodia seriata]|uniref:Putative het domain n=1 Tax=Diplodia seriata TaxID=420778 RepID=A0A0G2FU49_9PEZI|nr:putative het domain [Diplodia seriata]